MPIQKFELCLVKSYMITRNTKELILERKDKLGLNFIAGQFITFLFENKDNPKKPKRRSYSIASFPINENYLKISISYVENGLATDKLFNMKEGDSFNAMGPAGKLILNKDEENVKRIFLVGTGTGIAPYRAMLPDMATNYQDIEFHIFLGVQKREDALYSNDFQEYAKKYNHINFTCCLSREEKELQSFEKKGYVQNYFIKSNLNKDSDVIYLCGNPNMIDDSFKLLLNLGYNTKRIKREKYISSN